MRTNNLFLIRSDKSIFRRIMILLMLTVFMSASAAPLVKIRDIPTRGPVEYLDTTIVVEGTVSNYLRYEDSENAAPYYFLEGDVVGEVILIQSTAQFLPEKFKRYRITGVLKFDQNLPEEYGDKFYIFEMQRELIPGPNYPRGDDIEVDDDTTVEPIVPIVEETFWDKYGIIISIIAAVLVLMMFMTVILLLIVRKPSKNNQSVVVQPSVNPQGAATPAATTPSPSITPAEPMATTFGETTVALDGSVEVNMPNTVALWSAELEISSGLGRAGEKIRLFSVGDSVQIGRTKKGAPSRADFIGFEDPSNGLSRDQNKIRKVNAADGEKYILEYAKPGRPNKTLVNGNPLGEGESFELTNGTEITLPAASPITLKVHL